MAHALSKTTALFALILLALAHPAAAQRWPTVQTIAGIPVAEAEGYGAKVPFIEQEAENAFTTGTVIGPDRRFTTLASEASGRRAVRLEPGQYVEFVLANRANAVTVRYAIPDSADGKGLTSSLGISVGGRSIGVLATTSRYGWFYGAYPFTNKPADGTAHHFYDEARLLLGEALRAGTVVRLSAPAEASHWTVIDLADFELVAPAPSPPTGALSILDFGADPGGLRDSAPALDRAIAAARAARRPVWLPPGTYRISRHVAVDDVEIVGGGPWRSVLTGAGVGLYGRTDGTPSQRVILRDFAILGEVIERVDDDQVNGVGGAMGGGSLIDNLWIQHTKVGLWFDGPMDGITVRNLRILDQTADGLNFRRGVSRAVVENSFIRNAGDDGLAMWSHLDPDHDNVFRNNTIVAPILANGIAIYGGRDITVSGNLVADTLTQGGAFHVGNRFSAIPVSGTITLENNLAVRSGTFDPNWKDGVGALWFFALDAPMDARIVVQGGRLIDSSYAAINFRGQAVTGVELEDVAIQRAGTFAVQVQAPGAARLTRMTAEGLGAPGVLTCGADFAIDEGEGNLGWDQRVCDTAPRARNEALAQPPEPTPTTTLCQIFANPAAFDDKAVVVRAIAVTDYHHFSGLGDPDCGPTWMPYAWPKPPPLGAPAMESAVYAVQSRPTARVQATVTGVITAHPGQIPSLTITPSAYDHIAVVEVGAGR
jgi:hypothetical protein